MSKYTFEIYRKEIIEIEVNDGKDNIDYATATDQELSDYSKKIMKEME